MTSKIDEEHAQKQETKSSLYEFFASLPSSSDDVENPEEFPLVARSGLQRPSPEF